MTVRIPDDATTSGRFAGVLRRTPRTLAQLALAAALASGVVGTSGAGAGSNVSAPGGPGALSHFDLARKDCLGTARTTTSKVWYTVANGVLSDVYYPTVDNTNAETLQYVVTDGATFTDLQTRDMSFSVRGLDSSGMECRVTATAKSGKYEIATDYLTDPARNAVLMRTTFQSLGGPATKYRLYLRFDPTVNGNGGGGGGNGGGDSGTVDTSTGHPVLVASDTVTATNAANRDYAQPVYIALDASTPFGEVTNGFAGTVCDEEMRGWLDVVGVQARVSHPELVRHQDRVRRLIQLRPERVRRELAVDETVARHRAVRQLLAVEEEANRVACRLQFAVDEQRSPRLVKIA